MAGPSRRGVLRLHLAEEARRRYAGPDPDCFAGIAGRLRAQQRCREYQGEEGVSSYRLPNPTKNTPIRISASPRNLPRVNGSPNISRDHSSVQK